jgi:hypothetical protein
MGSKDNSFSAYGLLGFVSTESIWDYFLKNQENVIDPMLEENALLSGMTEFFKKQGREFPVWSKDAINRRLGITANQGVISKQDGMKNSAQECAGRIIKNLNQSVRLDSWKNTLCVRCQKSNRYEKTSGLCKKCYQNHCSVLRNES